ncbi:protein obstructor-E-like [Lutzomyia longipalpis]|uniref:protein obstructor-E-like n=1 Tax=Lutzomyia longipalpis TaxID=7200 RepID=UPI0024841783|nr:protein obstructor-E-like [Lutzomyia longipalpis]
MAGIFLAIVLLISAVGATTVIYPCPELGLARLPHATSCTKYVQCISGIHVIHECAEGLRYSSFNNRCRLPNLAGCGHDEFLCPLFHDPENLVYLADNDDCAVYYLCYNGVPQRFDCDEGLHWNVRDRKCDFPERANCRLVNINCPDSGFQVVPHPHNCERFFRCVSGQQFEARCPDGMLFDAIRNECYDRNYATCFLPSPPVNTTPTPPINTTPTPPVNTTPTPPVSTTPQVK